MTIQTIMNRMMLADNQLALESGGDDVTRGLTAVNLAQDWFEMVAARYGKLLMITGSTSTTANQEYTTWPTTLKRLDSLWMLDSNSNPIYELDEVDVIGGHVPSAGMPFPWMVLSGSVNPGRPDGFFPEGPGGRIYWSPKPDAIYNLRVYGFYAASDYTAAANTFAYPDEVALFIAPWATRAFRVGLDRDFVAVQEEAMKAAQEVCESLGSHTQTGPASRVYSDFHDA